MEVRDAIHQLFGIKEPHELPSKMMDVLMDSEHLSVIIRNYKNIFPDLQHDYLRDYFQENQADRHSLMQDYTPECICKIVAAITGKKNRIADLCAGTGSLTLGVWAESPESKFICYEKSSASIPFLLFNLALREIEAYVVHGDSITEETDQIYKVESGKVSKVDAIPGDKVDAVITNPPYSLKWSGSHDFRFGSYSTPPKGFADYAFILIGLNLLKDDGILTAILPHGVLFRGGQEEKIRTELIQDKRINSVVSLPPKLFANTQIPVAVVTFEKSDDGIFFVEAKEEFKAEGKQNQMEDSHIETVLSALKIRKKIDKLAYLADYKELKEEGYNLNIPRFVDTYEEEILPPPSESLRKIINHSKDLKKQKKELLAMMKEMQANDKETGEEFGEFLKDFEEWVEL